MNTTAPRAQGGQRGQGGAGQERRARQRRRSRAGAGPAGAARAGRDAARRRRGPGSRRVGRGSLCRTSSVVRAPAARQRGRRLHDLHAVGALEREADVGGHQHLEGPAAGRRHGFCSTHWMWPIITSWANGVASSARRSGPGRTRRKKPVTWRSSRTSAEPGARDPGAQAAHGHRLQDVVLLLLALLGQRDEGVGLLRLLQRPGRVAGQPAEGARRTARRPTRRCSGTGTSRRGRCAPARDSVGAVER